MSSGTLYDKVWDLHRVADLPGGSTQLFIGLHLIHEVTSPQAFAALEDKGLAVRCPQRTVATVDHIVPTTSQARPFADPLAEEMLSTLERNCSHHGITLHGLGSGRQGIVHVIAPELGLTQPGMTVACGDSHTSTHGAFGAIAFGIGTMGSRSTVIGGSALYYAAEKVIEKAKKIAAHMLEAAEADMEFGDGAFSVAGTDRAVTLTDVAKASFLPAKLPPGVEPGLFETATFAPDDDTYPNGSHVCEVEIDPETGETDVVGYWVVDDVGVMVNPVIVKGQIHGGVAQGVGQALGEQVAYERDSGQLLSGSFMDYRMPRAGDFPDIEIEGNGVPTQRNPLGVKGAGEAGTVGALPATMNAVMNALAQVGVTDLDMPATPDRVWQAIRDASKS